MAYRVNTGMLEKKINPKNIQLSTCVCVFVVSLFCFVLFYNLVTSTLSWALCVAECTECTVGHMVGRVCIMTVPTLNCYDVTSPDDTVDPLRRGVWESRG